MRAGIKTRSDVLKMGIAKYNEECRSIVMRCGCRCMHACVLPENSIECIILHLDSMPGMVPSEETVSDESSAATELQGLASAVGQNRYSKEWEKTVQRMGRWIDFQNDYKTLDPSFMESVWWVFSQLHQKGLVYRGFKARIYPCSRLLAQLGRLGLRAKA
jgi:isoleucyl-tRNA synthetase